MSSSTLKASKKMPFVRSMYAKIDHENQLEFKRLRAEDKAKGPKIKKNKKESLPKE